MKLIKGEFKEELELQLAPSIKAGFPSPAEDYLSESLDFNRDLIIHPEATFYATVDGDSMTGRIRPLPRSPPNSQSSSRYIVIAALSTTTPTASPP